MAKKQRAGKSYINYYSAYKLKIPYRSNRLRALTKHCKNNPNDINAKNSLDDLLKEVPYRRRKPIHRGINSINYPTHKFLKEYKPVNKNLINRTDLFPNKEMKLRPSSLRDQLGECK